MIEAETLYHKEGDKYSPSILVKNSGVILIQGRSILIDAQQVYKPVCWAINKIESDSVLVKIDLEYMNQSSKKFLNIILRILAHQSPGISIRVIWNTVADDIDSMDYGHILRELYPRIHFEFFSTI